MKSRVKLNKEKHKEIVKEKRQKRKQIFIKALVILLVFLSSTILYARFIGTKGLIINEHNVNIKNLPDSFNGFRIVHFTDLHYGNTVFKNELDNLQKQINYLEPEVVVFTGDLIDKRYHPTNQDLKIIINFFNNIKADVGKYIVSGNHDYNQKYFLEIVGDLKFTFLDNSSELIYYKSTTPIMITGLSSSEDEKINIDKAFNYYKDQNNNKDIVNITILHEPDNVDKILKQYPSNLFLAGHSHNGQVRLPYIGGLYKVKGARKYDDSYYKINNSELYISGGVGNSALNLRLFCHPSINMYRLIKK